MYKSIFELASDRADFLSRLFSRKRPEGLESSASAKQLFDAFAGVAPDPVYYHETLHAITENLTKKHRFTLTERDVKDLEYVFGAFFDGGPDITYSGPFGGRRMPTFATLMVQTDGEVNRSYMGSEETFKILQDMQKRNLVIPLVGDFAGPKALRAIGDYLKANGAAVSIIYTSNVEQYLFQQDEDWMKYYKNVETLPLDASAIFIRSAFNLGFNYGAPGGASGRFTPSRQLLSSVTELLKAFSAGEIKGYWDVLNMSN